MLQERIKTALILVALLLCALLIGGFILTGLALVLFGLLSYEFFTFATSYSFSRRLQLVCCNLILPISFLLNGWQGLAGGAVLAALLLFSLHLYELAEVQHAPDISHEVPAVALGFTYCGILSSLLVVIASHEVGPVLLAWLFIVVISSDTGAYFSGRLIGGKKLFERVSPKKTVSGGVGGLVAAVAFGTLSLYVLPLKTGVVELICLSLIAGVLAQVGDLTESLIKRAYAVKDSSNLLPGHGGLLDRLDALIFAAPVALFLQVVPGGSLF